MSEPKILNILNTPYYSGYSAFFNNSNLRDLNPLTVVNSYGYSSDGTAVEGTYSYVIADSIYTGVIFLYHNLRFGNINDYSILNDGAAISGKTMAEVTDFYGFRHTVIRFPRISIRYLNISFSHTEPIGQEKTMGELLLVNEETVSLTRDFSSYDQRFREKVKEIVLGDGGIHRVITLSGTGKNLRYEANCQFKFMTPQEVESLRALKESGTPFYFQPESETNPQNIYLCHWTGPWDVKYTSSYKGAGLTVNMQIKEVR
jgi:hypothetical protein